MYQSNNIVDPIKAGVSKVPKTLLVGLAFMVCLVAGGCSQGAYPLDFFYEMHYQQSFKAQEPPRLSVPESAVPRFPPPEVTSYTSGEHLFQVNCSMCHGQAAKGSANQDGAGPVLQNMVDKYGYEQKAPTDLTLFPIEFIEAILGFTPVPDVLERPFGNDSVMPAFTKLLSAEERRAIAEYIVSLPK
jgi:mono/diheme cytochrome c family protein